MHRRAGKPGGSLVMWVAGELQARARRDGKAWLRRSPAQRDLSARELLRPGAVVRMERGADPARRGGGVGRGDLYDPARLYDGGLSLIARAVAWVEARPVVANLVEGEGVGGGEGEGVREATS